MHSGSDKEVTKEMLVVLSPSNFLETVILQKIIDLRRKASIDNFISVPVLGLVFQDVHCDM